MHPDWVRLIHYQCADAGIPFFFKQWGEWFPHDEWKHNPELILPDDDVAYTDSAHTHVFEGTDGLYPVHRVGKKKAGRLLDGRTWDEMPD
jgi:protein gp37